MGYVSDCFGRAERKISQIGVPIALERLSEASLEFSSLVLLSPGQCSEVKLTVVQFGVVRNLLAHPQYGCSGGIQRSQEGIQGKRVLDPTPILVGSHPSRS